MGLHAPIRQVLSQYDPVHVLTHRLILPVNEFNLDEVIQIHRIIQDTRRWPNLFDRLLHKT